MRRILAVLCLLFPLGAQGASTLMVGSGQTYETIAAAYAAASAGDTIQINDAGPYVEDLTIGKANLTITATTEQEPVIQGEFSVQAGGTGLTVSDLSFDGRGLDDNGIKVNGAPDNITVDGCAFEGYRWHAVEVVSDDFKAGDGTYGDNITVRDCDVTDCGKGFSLAGDTLLITGNEVDGMTRRAASGDNDYCRIFGNGVTVTGNTFHNADVAALAADGSHVDCLQTYHYNGEYLKGTVLIEGNWFADCHQIIQANGEEDNSSHTGFTFANNVCLNFESWGVNAHDQTNVLIYNNTFFDPYGSPAIGAREGTAVVAKNNALIYSWSVIDPGGSLTTDYNAVYASNADPTDDNFTGANDITLTPVQLAAAFTDGANDDWTLAADSVLIDVGANVGLVADYADNARPTGAGYDIGAYEFQPEGGATNTMPTVAVSASATILALPAQDSTVVTCTATDDGEPDPPGALTYAWTATGPAAVTFADDSATTTTATFTVGGSYHLTCTVSDGELEGSDEVTVALSHPPTSGIRVRLMRMLKMFRML